MRDSSRPTTIPEVETARRFLIIAVGALVVAGGLSLALVVGRLPQCAAWVHDPLFFRRCLVVHVVLALVVWFYAYTAALTATLPSAGTSGLLSRLAPGIAAAGLVAVVGSAWATGAKPVLANYVPMIEHPVFERGLVVFGAGIVLGIADARLLPGSAPGGGFLRAPAAAQVGIRSAGIALLLAAITFAVSWAVSPAGLTAEVQFELANWGGGHVLQLASVCAMLSAWIILIAGALGRSPVSRRFAAAAFGALLVPWLAAPVFAARGVQDLAGRSGFTYLMQYGLLAPITAMTVACAAAVFRAKRDGTLSRPLSDPAILGFATSATLTFVGFGLGAAVRGSTTTIPGHYHASIGAVTTAFMALAYPMLSALGYRLPQGTSARLRHLQPVLFGVGQVVFAIGFALAGAHGMARKVYGAEQVARDGVAALGLMVMAAGGVVAVGGGLLFLVLVVSVLRHGRPLHDRIEPRAMYWRLPWKQTVASIQSKS